MCIRDRAYLQKLVRPVELVAALDDGETSRELRELLVELTQLSDKVTLREARAPGDRVPSFAIASPDSTKAGHEIAVRFAGMPMGHEFTSLVLALLQVGGHPSKLAQDTIERIRDLEGNGPDSVMRFETYFSLSCQNCPDVVQALNLMAVLNPRIEHVAIDGALFQDEVEARQIMSVPTVYLLSLIHI